MNNNLGALYFDAGVDMENWRKNINEMRRDILGLSQQTQRETSKMDSMFKNLSIGIGAYLSANVLKGFVNELINVRGEFQKTEIAFATMLKDAGKAKQLMAEMVDLAAKTPFGLKEVSDGAKRLLAFQIPANEVVDTLRRMGDVAAGLGVPMGQLIHVYGQVKAQGRLMTNDLYQFMNAGIPIIAELSKVLGKSESEIKKMVGEGKIGFAEIQQVIKGMTDEGGLFFNLMEKQSASLSGKISNLRDTIEQMMNKIGESSEGILNKGIDAATYLVEHYEEVIKVLTVLISTYGSYRVALMLVAAAQKISVTVQAVSTWLSLARSIKTAKDAQILFNLASSANPIGAVVAVIGLVISAYVMYGDEIKKLIGLKEEETIATKTQIDVEKELTENFSKGVAEKQAKIQQLINIIKNENATLEQRKRAYESLIAIDPSFRGTLDAQYKETYRLGEAFDLLIIKLRAFAKAQAEMAVQAKYLQQQAEESFKLGDLQVQLKQVQEKKAALLKKGFREIKVLGGFGGSYETIIPIKGDRYYDKEASEYGKIKKQENELKEQIAEQKKISNETTAKANNITKQIEQNKKQKEINLKHISNQISHLENKKNLTAGEKKILDALKKGKDANSFVLGGYDTKIEENIPSSPPSSTNIKDKKAKGEKELAEIFPKDSIKELEQRIALYNNALERAYTDKKGNKFIKLRALDKYGKEYETGKTLSIDKAVANKEALEKRLKEIQDEIRNKAFDEDISELERQWKVRYMIAEKYGEKIAEVQFPNLKGESYFNEIEEMFNPLNDRLNKGEILSDEEIKQWQRLKEIIDGLSGIKDPFTNFKEGLDKSLSQITIYTEKIDFLKDKLDNLTSEEISKGFKTEILARIEAEEKLKSENYKRFIESHKTYEEQITEITKKYAELREQANSDAEIKKVDEAKSAELTELFFSEMQKSNDWARLFTEMNAVATQKLEEFRSILVEKLKSAKTEEERIKIGEFIKKIDAEMRQRAPFKSLVKAIKELGDASKSSEEKLSNLYNAFSEASKWIGDTKKAVGEAKTALEDLGISTNNAFGDLLDKLSEALNGLEQTANGVANVIQGITSKNPVQIIAGSIKAIAGVIKTISSFFNSDKAKERNIKRWKEEIDGLSNAYRDLEHAMKNALGTETYKIQESQIQNMRAQQAKLRQMIDEERGKKKTDDGKIRDWEEQINQLSRNIDDVKENIKKNILQGTAKDFAKQLGDALVDAFKRGESAAVAFDRTIEDIIRKITLNMITQKFLEPMMKQMSDELLIKSGFSKDYNKTIREREEELKHSLEQIEANKNYWKTEWKFGAFREAIDKDKKRKYDEAISRKQQLEQEIASLRKRLQNGETDIDPNGDFKSITENMLDEIKEKYKNDPRYKASLEAIEALQKMMKQDNQDSLKGAIKGMSEQTAGVLAGQFNAIRQHVAEILKNGDHSLSELNNILSTLMNIEGYTFRLISIEKEIKELNGKVKSTDLRGSGL